MFCDKHKRELRERMRDPQAFADFGSQLEASGRLVLRVKDIDPSTITLIVYRGRELRYHGDDRWFMAMHGQEEVQPTVDGYVGEEFQITAQHPPRQDPIIRQDKFASSVGLGV